MFTGIVETTAPVVEWASTPSGQRLGIPRPVAWPEVRPGASVAVSGACLTVTEGSDDSVLRFDIVAETLRRTRLGGLKLGSLVNLERSVRAGQPMDGHFVQGHVDAVTTVVTLTADPVDCRMGLALSEDVRPFIVPKGSVAVEGVSLTVAVVGRSHFEAALIPTTLRLTTLGLLKIGDVVNLETDMMSRTHWHQWRLLHSEWTERQTS